MFLASGIYGLLLPMEQSGNGIGMKAPSRWEKAFPSQHIPSAHGTVTSSQERKKKVGFALNPLHPLEFFPQNFPALVDLGRNPNSGCDRDGDEPQMLQGRGENPPGIHGNGVFGIKSCVS